MNLRFTSREGRHSGGDLRRRRWRHRSVQDRGVSHDELEPFCGHFGRICGMGGRAGDLRDRVRRDPPL